MISRFYKTEILSDSQDYSELHVDTQDPRDSVHSHNLTMSEHGPHCLPTDSLDTLSIIYTLLKHAYSNI